MARHKSYDSSEKFEIKKLKEEIPKDLCKFWKFVEKDLEQCLRIEKRVACEGLNTHCIFFLEYLKEEKRKANPFFSEFDEENDDFDDDDF